MDNPGLLVACVIGDGEAETGALAASWHANKFLDPVSDGTVLPILHLNGYKIANPTGPSVTRSNLGARPSAGSSTPCRGRRLEPAAADLVGHDPYEPLLRCCVPREQREIGSVVE